MCQFVNAQKPSQALLFRLATIWYHFEKFANLVFKQNCSVQVRRLLYSTLKNWVQKILFLDDGWNWIQHFEFNDGIFSILNYSAPIDLWYSYLYDINNSQKMFVLLIYFGKRYDLNLILFAVNEVPIRGIAFILKH